MKIARLQLSIQTVKENIAILESQEPEGAGYELQLEHEKMVLDVLEKQMPKRPVREIVCPACKALVGSSPYCKYCGQRLDHTAHPTEKDERGNEWLYSDIDDLIDMEHPTEKGGRE